VAALLCAYEDQGGDVATAFTQWDETGDGQLSAREILGGLRRLGAKFEYVDDVDVGAIVDSVDREPDGHMDLADFVEFVRKGRAHF
jgi:Ca2+-binding EF-hand superfamily protein